MWITLFSKLVNMQKGRRAYTISEHHYDVGNDMYSRMLYKRMVYTCGYWKDTQTLEEAQDAKLDLVCRKKRCAATYPSISDCRIIVR